jgi:hypothetical protein
MAKAAEFRTCPTTGLKVDRAAEKLIKANAVVAVVFLAVGGLFGLLVALTRWPAVHFLPADWFYLALTAHGLDVLLVWIIFFEMAVLYFASAILLNSRLAGPRWAWTGFGLMLVGAIMTNIAVLRGQSSVMFTSYVPMQAEPAFYLGIILFAVGALIGCGVFFGTLVVAKAEKTYEGSVPLVTFGALTAAIIAVFTIASGAIILIPTFLWSVGLVAYVDPLVYKTIWWGMGHSSQQINVSAHVAVWYAIAAMVFGAKPLSEKVSRMAFLMYILFLQLASAHHMLVEPGFSAEWRIFNTSYAMYLAVLGSMVHGLTVPGSIEAAQRSRGLTKGLFEWLRIVRMAAQGTLGQPGVFRNVHVTRVFRIHWRHLRRRYGYRANQPDHSQHALCARPFPWHGSGRYDARFHGDHLHTRTADIPARADDEEDCPMAAVCFRYWCGRYFAVHDGCRNLGRRETTLGHDLFRCNTAVRLSIRSVPDDGAQRSVCHHGGRRRYHVRRRRGRLRVLRQETRGRRIADLSRGSTSLRRRE